MFEEAAKAENGSTGSSSAKALRGSASGDPKTSSAAEWPERNRRLPARFISPATNTGPTGDQAAGYDENSMRPRNRTLVQRCFDSK